MSGAGNDDGTIIYGAFTATYTRQWPLKCEGSSAGDLPSAFTCEATIDGFTYALRLRITDAGEPHDTIGEFLEFFLASLNGRPDLDRYLGNIEVGNLMAHQ